jgi:hypothetical protein
MDKLQQLVSRRHVANFEDNVTPWQVSNAIDKESLNSTVIHSWMTQQYRFQNLEHLKR